MRISSRITLVLALGLAATGALVACSGVDAGQDRYGEYGKAGRATEEEDDEGDTTSTDAAPAPSATLTAEPPPPTPDAGAPPPDAAPPPPPPEPVPAGSFAVGKTLTTTADLNLRDAPINGAVLLVIPNGGTVKVVKISGSDGWVNVDYDGTVGWASKAYLQE